MTDEQLKQFELQIAKSIDDGVQKHVPNIVEKIADEKIQAEVKRLGLDKLDLKNGNFAGHPSDNQLSRKQKAVDFIKAVFRKDMAKLATLGCKGMTEGTDSEGGFLVPEEVMTEVDRCVANYGLIRKLARIVPMRRDNLVFPTVGSGATVEWAGEANEGSDGAPKLRGVKLDSRTCIGLSPVTNELLADADVSIIDMLLELFAEAIAGAEDYQGLVGVGTPFTGILSHADVNIVTAATADEFDEIDLNDLRDMITPLPETALVGANYVMHKEIWAMIQKITEDSQHVVGFSNVPAFVSMKPEGGLIQPAGYLWGYPVYTSDFMPDLADSDELTKFIIFGNFKKFYLGNRQQTALDIGKEATVGGVNAFASNQSIVRVLERVALSVGVPEAFSVLKTNATSPR